MLLGTRKGNNMAILYAMANGESCYANIHHGVLIKGEGSLFSRVMVRESAFLLHYKPMLMVCTDPIVCACLTCRRQTS